MIRISLIPYREARRQKRFQAIVTAWGIVAVLGLGTAFWVDSLMTDRIKALKAQEIENTATIASLDRRLGEIKDIESKKKKIQDRMSAIRDLNQLRVLLIHVLDEVTNTIPEKIWLTRLETKQNSLRLTGLAQSNALVADFMQRMESSPYFANIELAQVTQVVMKGDKLKSFSLDLHIGMPKSENQEESEGEK